MLQKEIFEILGVPTRTLRGWKSSNKGNLYRLLRQIDKQTVESLIAIDNDYDIKRLLENELHFSSYRVFEKELYEVLVSGRDNAVFLRLSHDNSLSNIARARAAYLYTKMTHKQVHLSFKTAVNVGLYYSNKVVTGDGEAEDYGLLNGLDMDRFNQFRMTGSF